MIEKAAYLTAELGPYPERPSHRRTSERPATRIEMYRDSFASHTAMSTARFANSADPRHAREGRGGRSDRRCADLAGTFPQCDD